MTFSNRESTGIIVNVMALDYLSSTNTANNIANEFTTQADRSMELGPFGSTTSIKTVELLVDIAKLNGMSRETLIGSSEWYQNYANYITRYSALYFQGFHLDLSTFVTGYEVKIEIEYVCQPTLKNRFLLA